MKAAVQAVIDVGYDIERVEVDKNGTVSILTRNPILNSSERIAPPGCDWDEVLPGAVS